MGFWGGEIDPSAPINGQVRTLWSRVLDHRLRRHDDVSFMEPFIGSAYVTEKSRAIAFQLCWDAVRI
jgi:hypothetical protein